MLDKIMDLVRENSGDEIVRNPAIPDQYNDEAIKDAGEEISNGLKQEASQGNIGNIAALFNQSEGGGISGNPTVQSIISNLATKFAGKFGISPAIASSVAAGLVPKVLGQFVNKAKDPNDNSLDLQDILKNLTGGNGNIGDLMAQFTNGDKGGLGKALGNMFNK